MRGLVGSPAPFFALDDQFGQRHASTDFAGSTVLLVFYPFAFSPICSSELAELNALAADGSGPKSPVILGISVDSKYTLREFADKHAPALTLLSDFWPHGAAADRYYAFDEFHGRAGRGTVIIGHDGIVRAAELSNPGRARDLGQWVRSARAGRE